MTIEASDGLEFPTFDQAKDVKCPVCGNPIEFKDSPPGKDPTLYGLATAEHEDCNRHWYISPAGKYRLAMIIPPPEPSDEEKEKKAEAEGKAKPKSKEEKEEDKDLKKAQREAEMISEQAKSAKDRKDAKAASETMESQLEDEDTTKAKSRSPMRR